MTEYSPIGKLLTLLHEEAYEHRDEPFTLRSGKQSHDYVNCRKIVCVPAWRRQAVELLAAAATSRWLFGNIAGVPLGGLVLAAEISTKLDMPLLQVRKEAKDHGTKSRIETPWGDKSYTEPYPVLLVEDVVTTGQSVVETIHTLRAHDLKVAGVVTLVDREDGGRAAIEELGVPFVPLFPLSSVIGTKRRSR